MNTLSKLAALAFFVGGAAVISSAAPSRAQADRQFQSATGPAILPQCCRPATVNVSTGTPGWTVQSPASPTSSPAVLITPPNGSWSTVPGSQWIGNSANAGNVAQPGGNYIYEKHLGCLCNAPKGVAMPVTLSLKIFADDDFTAYVNGSQVAQHTGGYGFSTPAGGTPAVTTSTTFMPACDNVLTIVVPNWNGLFPGSSGPPPGSPTGLDVGGTVSGYFLDLPRGAHCPRCPARPPIPTSSTK